MKLMMKEKNNEHRRLKENFDIVKIANDTLRKEVNDYYVISHECKLILLNLYIVLKLKLQ